VTNVALTNSVPDRNINLMSASAQPGETKSTNYCMLYFLSYFTCSGFPR